MADILAGIRILDLTRLQPGPFCTQILGDLGAEVIKIENPRGGDYLRWYPPLGKSESGWFLALNRNKKSLRLDIWSPRGKEVFADLADTADIVVEQYRPGTLESVGLGYSHLAERNPRIIFASISAYGQKGPSRSKAGHDINALALSGILQATGVRYGPPALPGVQIADMAAALWSALGLIAAVLEREHSGKGQYLDISLLDSLLSFQSMAAGAFFMDRHVPERGDEPLNGACAWYNVYPTADDQYLAVGLLEFKFWRSFCRVLGCEQFIDRQFASREVQTAMKETIGEIMRQRSLKEWLDIFDPLDICVTPVRNLAEVLHDAHLDERQMIQEIDHAAEGTISVLATPVKFSRTPGRVNMAPPRFGEHTDEILSQMGMSYQTMEELRRLGVI